VAKRSYGTGRLYVVVDRAVRELVRLMVGRRHAYIAHLENVMERKRTTVRLSRLPAPSLSPFLRATIRQATSPPANAGHPEPGGAAPTYAGELVSGTPHVGGDALALTPAQRSRVTPPTRLA
jgi:hypothetical protein